MQWTLFANSTFCEAFFNGPKPAQQAAMLATLDGLLADPKKPYLTGTEATLADISVGSYLLYLPMFFPDMDLVQYKHMWAYMKRLAARPTCPASYKEAMAKAVEKAEGAGAAGGLMGMLKKVTGGA